MKNLILVLALLSPVFLSAQKTQNRNNSRATQTRGTCCASNTQKQNCKPMPPGERESQRMEKESQNRDNQNRKTDYIEDRKMADYIRVVYYMKDEAVKFRTFRTLAAAEDFTVTLANNPNCIRYYIDNMR